MNAETDTLINQSYNSYLHTPVILKETDTDALTQLLLEELHSALCWQKQTLAEAAEEIQRLLKQLEESHPTATEAEQQALITAAIPPLRREQFLSALQAGWNEAIQEFLTHSYLNLGVAILEGWKTND